MKTLASLITGALIGAALTVPTPVLAFGDGTPDAQPPAEESPCDTAGLTGSVYGLCIAFCEANDCETQPDTRACRVLRANLQARTGANLFPCEIVSAPEVE